jgi:hypothetical protein
MIYINIHIKIIYFHFYYHFIIFDDFIAKLMNNYSIKHFKLNNLNDFIYLILILIN